MNVQLLRIINKVRNKVQPVKDITAESDLVNLARRMVRCPHCDASVKFLWVHQLTVQCGLCGQRFFVMPLYSDQWAKDYELTAVKPEIVEAMAALFPGMYTGDAERLALVLLAFIGRKIGEHFEEAKPT